MPIERLCAHAGVAPSNAWVTSDFFRIWTAAEEEFQDPGAGIRFGDEGIARGYGVAAIVALHAPDFRSALAALSRYKSLTCPEFVEVEVKGGEAAVRYRWLQANGPVPRLLVDMTMASLRQLAWRGTGGKVTPIRLELTRRPSEEELLHRHFECPIVFGAASEAMVFDRAALDVPFLTADGGAFAHVLGDLEQRIRAGEGFPAFVGEVSVAIARQLSEGREPSVAAVAGRLNLSTRTLQRRLHELGTNFQEQLAGVRRTTAGRLLIATDLDAVAISMLVGFVEPNSFVRAFRRWERTTPTRWRAQRVDDHSIHEETPS
ncbi:AraC family transcriptional regulator [Sphingomonas kyeonggiensis]|uniref:AraC-like DNA-binding protein n=1 Tax=Sphingomonas kyeonggiensis TaxID=1268553 RepID=A0A7W6NY95_9SPHN|nr:AraC family transcriptional regulator [Sphingomonas kyeonggiensis]MBB4099354.1 AraC-like DNA-binding protein [Sphingomonas kyeonggiensis]